MLFYFTGTGNSLYVARQIEEKPISIPQILHQENLNFKDEKIGIFLCSLFSFCEFVFCSFIAILISIDFYQNNAKVSNSKKSTSECIHA